MSDVAVSFAIQYVIVGALVWIVAKIELTHVIHVIHTLNFFAKLFPKWQAGWTLFETVLAHGVKIVLGALAAFLFLDPLIPGTALVEVHAPPAERRGTLLEHLQVRVVPVGLHGEAGGTRTFTVNFDTRGVAAFAVRLHLLESRVKLDVFNVTQSGSPIDRKSVYVSPFVRRQLWLLNVTF